MPKVSIVIPSWNRKQDLRRCLDSIMSLSYKEIEIFVVDNGSSDGTKEMLINWYPGVKLIANSKNLGAAYARNQGIIVSSGDFIWFLDSDTEILNPDCLSEMVNIMNRNPQVGAVGGELIIEDNIEKIKIHKPLKFGVGIVTFLRKDECHMVECKFLSTANYLVRKELLLKVGGFDPHYFYLGEDADLCIKMHKLEYKSIIDKNTVVVHHLSKTQRRSNLYLQEKNRVRGVLLHSNIFIIPIFPLLDFLFLLSTLPLQYKQLKKRRISNMPSVNVQYKKGTNKKEGSVLKRLFVIVPIYVLSIIYSYCWNLLFFLQTMYLRFKQPNYLSKMKQK